MSGEAVRNAMERRQSNDERGVAPGRKARMKASECYVGLKLRLQMEWAEADRETQRRPTDTATCIYVPENKSYGLFQFRNGLKQTVPLEDDSRLACDVKDTSEVPPDMIHPARGQSKIGNNRKLETAIMEANVTKKAVSCKGGRSASYLATMMRNRELTDDELDYWMGITDEAAAEIRQPIDEHDPNYTIKKALQDCGLSAPEASRLCGKSKSWLRTAMSKPLSDGRQLEIATMIRRAAARARAEEREAAEA